MCSCVDTHAVAEQLIDTFLATRPSLKTTAKDCPQSLETMDHESLMLYLISHNVNVYPLIQARAACVHNPPYMKPVKFMTSVHIINTNIKPTNKLAILIFSHFDKRC